MSFIHLLSNLKLIYLVDFWNVRKLYIYIYLAFLYEIFYYPIILIFDKYDEQTYYIMIIGFKKKKKKYQYNQISLYGVIL